MFANLTQDAKIFLDLILSEVNEFRIFYLFKKDAPLFYESTEGLKFKLRAGVHDSSVIIENLWLKGYWRYFNDKQADNDGVIIDIGGHIGSFCIPAAVNHKQARVLTFEPNKESFDLLCKNIISNELQATITPFNLAVSSGNGEGLTLEIDATDTGKCHTRKTDNPNSIATISFREIIINNRVRSCELLKIDCEGYEAPILKSITKEEFSIINKLVVECHGNSDILEIEKILVNNGFKIKKYKVIEGSPLLIFWNAPLIAAWRD